MITSKKIIILVTSFITINLFSSPVKGENLAHVSQLLRTKECQECDLSDAGLVMANLTGADLTGANLIGANLSRANLTGANLTNVNLSGASLHGANLTGANLTGAILNHTDLRNAYVVNANFSNTDLTTAYVNGIVGIPPEAVSPEQFYQWALIEDRNGNYAGALEHYNSAIAINPDFSEAYLARGIIRSRYGQSAIAIEDFEKAQRLFQKQNNQQGYILADNFIELLKAKDTQEKSNKSRGNPQFVQAISGILPFLFRFLSF